MMSSSILLAGLVCIIAGATIRAWAFAVFAVFLVIAISTASLIGGGTLGHTALLAITLVVVMEVCYLLGVVGAYLSRHRLRQRLPQRSDKKPAAALQKAMQVQRDRSQR